MTAGLIGQDVRVVVLQPSREPAARGLIHEAGDVLNGVQHCHRCGQDLHVSPDGTGWPPGSLVEHELWDSGEAMHSVRHGRESRHPECERPSTSPDP